MGRFKNAYGDYELLRAYQETVKYLEDELDVVVRTHVSLHGGVGRIGIRIEAHEAPVKPYAKPLAAYESTWPGPKAESWPACLYSSAMALVRLVEDSRRPALNELPRVPVKTRRRRQ